MNRHRPGSSQRNVVPGSMTAALIGCGQIASVHADALRRAGISIIAVCDRDHQRASELALRTDAARVFTETDALFREARPDTAHVPDAAVKSRKGSLSRQPKRLHAIVEKPIALSVAEADVMIESARRHDVNIIPHHNYLYKPSIIRARGLSEMARSAKSFTWSRSTASATRAARTAEQAAPTGAARFTQVGSLRTSFPT